MFSACVALSLAVMFVQCEAHGDVKLPPNAPPLHRAAASLDVDAVRTILAQPG